MPSPSSVRRRAPGDPGETAADVEAPSASPPALEESEDERQYMMLRHSDDETNGNGSGGQRGSGPASGPEGGPPRQHHVIPKSPDRALLPQPPRGVAARGRASSAPTAAHYPPQHGPYPPHYAHGYQGYEPPAAPPPPGQPYGYHPGPHGGPPGGPHGRPGGPPAYTRGASEGYDYQGGYDSPPYDPRAVDAAPSWGSIDIRQMGTFDHGEVRPWEPHGTNVITPAQPFRKAGSRVPQGSQASPSQPPPAVPPHSGGGVSPGRGGHGHYMYPPSSPIKAGPSPNSSSAGSPEAGGRSNSGSSEDEMAAAWLPPQSSSAKRSRSKGGTKEIKTPRRRDGAEPAAVHVPPGPSKRPAATTDRTRGGVVRPQFVRTPRTTPSRAPGGSVSFASNTAGPAAAGGGAPPSHHRPSRPPLVVDSSRSNDSSESPGRSLQGGRVQLVGGGIGEDGAPWNLVGRQPSAVSRSRSMESHGSGSGSGQYWEPPRPHRMGVVPPPGRPDAATRASSAPTSRAGAPGGYPPDVRPPPPHRGQSHPGWDYYGGGQGGAAPPPPGPPPPGIRRTGSSAAHPPGPPGPHHPDYPPVSYSPEGRAPPPPPSSSQAYPGHPPTGGPGYPPYPYPPGPYHPSQYPPGPYYPGGPPGHHPSQTPGPGYGPLGPPPMVDLDRDDDVRGPPTPVHPLLKDYNPHKDSIGVRPQFRNVKKQKADARRNAAMAAAGAPANTPRRRRRRNPTEKAAAAAAMAAAAAASLQEHKEKMARKKQEEDAKAAGAGTGNDKENSPNGAGPPNPSTVDAGRIVDVDGSPFSEEELKTLGSGDDEDIPAAKRAAMASAVALRAAAGGSPLAPPKSASEVTFDVANPPLSPVLPPSSAPVLESATLMTENDVLCGRGGGTNSQMGNRRFRALVRDFQPTYLMAKRREKPRMARSVVLIVRHRGGRFLRRDEGDGRLYEVGDEKAEAKTSQALREGLDVRATKTAANTLMCANGEAGGGGSSSGSGGESGGAKKRKQSSPSAPEVGVIKMKEGNGKSSGGETRASPVKKAPPVRPRPVPVHAPGYRPNPNPRPSHPPSSGGPPRPTGPEYYPPYPPRYDDPYYRSRYPPNAPPGHEYGGSGPPPPGPHRSPHPPPPSAAHHHYTPGMVGYPPPTPYDGYPPHAAEPAGAGAYPSTPRSSHEGAGPGRGDTRAEAAYSPPRAGGPVVARPEVSR